MRWLRAGLSPACVVPEAGTLLKEGMSTYAKPSSSMSPGVMSSGLNRALELEDGLGVAAGGASGEDSFEADFGPFRFEPFLFFFFFCTLAGFGPVAAVVVFSDFAFGFWACLLLAGAGLAGAAAGDDPDLGSWDRVTAMLLFAVWYKMGCRTLRE
jgi:hypothetical protein